jgi:small nuclear ribonucleoprotein (snRNP)-like protein
MDVIQVFLNIVLDDAVEEKDGGEKVRLGMVVRLQRVVAFLLIHGDQNANIATGHSRKLRRHARSIGENSSGETTANEGLNGDGCGIKDLDVLV